MTFFTQSVLFLPGFQCSPVFLSNLLSSNGKPAATPSWYNSCREIGQSDFSTCKKRRPWLVEKEQKRDGNTNGIMQKKGHMPQ